MKKAFHGFNNNGVLKALQESIWSSIYTFTKCFKLDEPFLADLPWLGINKDYLFYYIPFSVIYTFKNVVALALDIFCCCYNSYSRSNGSEENIMLFECLFKCSL